MRRRAADLDLRLATNQTRRSKDGSVAQAIGIGLPAGLEHGPATQMRAGLCLCDGPGTVVMFPDEYQVHGPVKAHRRVKQAGRGLPRSRPGVGAALRLERNPPLIFTHKKSQREWTRRR